MVCARIIGVISGLLVIHLLIRGEATTEVGMQEQLCKQSGITVTSGEGMPDQISN